MNLFLKLPEMCQICEISLFFMCFFLTLFAILIFENFQNICSDFSSKEMPSKPEKDSEQIFQC